MASEVSALVFDAYGTIFDVHSVQALAESFFPGKGAALSAAWRTKQLEYTWQRSLMGRYEDFSRVTLSALEWTFESLGLEPEESQRRALRETSPGASPSRSSPTATPTCWTRWWSSTG